MFKALRLIAFLIFIMVGIAPAPTEAVPPIPCDGTLFSAAAFTAINGDSSPVILPNFQEYIVVDTPYFVRYRLYYSPTVNTGVFELYRGKQLIGHAINSTWQVCAPGNGWKSYLIAKGHQP